MSRPRIVNNLLWMIAGIGVVTLCIFFPRFLAFLELAMRELRYLWWLILLVAVGTYLTFRKRD